MEFCFFYFLCLFIVYFLSKNLISARLITMLIDLCLCLVFFFFFFLIIRLGWIGPRIRPRSGWTGPVETQRAGFEAKKKTRLLNGLIQVTGRTCGLGPGIKNLARTQPVAIPIDKLVTEFFLLKLQWLKHPWIDKVGQNRGFN